MIKKIVFLSLTLLAIVGCSHDDASTSTPQPTALAMSAKIDNVLYNFSAQNSGNIADNTGGSYGSNYFLLKGVNGSGPAGRIVNKTIEIKVVIPKANITLGTHPFSSSLASGGYYIDMDYLNTLPAEIVNTVGGSINITSYDSTTKEVKGTFSFSVEDGVTSPSHIVTAGNFDFFLL